MNAMTVPPMTPPAMPQNQDQEVPEEVVDIPQQQDAEQSAWNAEEVPAEVATGTEPETELEPETETETETETEPAGEVVEVVEEKGEKEEKEDKDEKKAAAKPKRKSTPRKAAGTSKTLVVLKEGRVQYADADAVVVVDLDEAASPDTDVHDVLDRLTELREAAESPAKADAVRALTDLIQEKALG
jgi:hypothetical protein